MAKFEPRQIDITDINNGNKYVNGSMVGATDFTLPVESVVWSQTIVDNLSQTPDTSSAYLVGTPTVSLIDGNVVSVNDTNITTKKFKFSYLKGEQGEEGYEFFRISSSTTINTAGGSIQKSEIANPLSRTFKVGDLIMDKNGLVANITSVAYNYVSYSYYATLKGDTGAGMTYSEDGGTHTQGTVNFDLTDLVLTITINS